MSSLPSRLSEHLKGSSALKPLAARLAELDKLQGAYARCVPTELLPFSRVGALEGTTLVLTCATAAAAAQLRQRIPSVLAKIRKESVNVTDIRVVAQPAVTQCNGPGRTRVEASTMPAAVRRRLADMAENLPDSKLKRVLLELAEKRGR